MIASDATTSSRAIQAGHFTIASVSVAPTELEPDIKALVAAENERRNKPRNRVSLMQYARAAQLAKSCRALIATRKRPNGRRAAQDKGGLWWSEFESVGNEDTDLDIEHVMVLRYRQQNHALEDLKHAVELLRQSDDNVRSELYILVGDFNVPPDARSWILELLLPREYRQVLRGAPYVPLSEAKCRNVGKRRLLDKVVKRLRGTPKLWKEWYERAGASVIADPESPQLQLASHVAIDHRNHRLAGGHIKLLRPSGNVTCGLILAGMLEYFRRQGHGHAVLFFDRRDDPYIRMKVLDASAIHSIFSSWLRQHAVTIELRWASSSGTDRWRGDSFVESSPIGAWSEFSSEFLGSAYPVGDSPVNSRPKPRTEPVSFEGCLKGPEIWDSCGFEERELKPTRSDTAPSHRVNDRC